MGRAASIAVKETIMFLEKSRAVERVVLVCFGKEAVELYQRALASAGGISA